MQALTFGQLTLTSPAQTEAFAKALAPVLRAGDTLLLEGEIGAGKSAFSRAVIQARLAEENRMEDVPSPTFTLVQVYELSGLEIWHCDLYRLTSVEEVLDLGLEDAFESAICLIEWPDRLQDLAPDGALFLSLSTPENAAQSRDLALRGDDPAWRARLAPVLERSIT